jgi:DNA/RNA endonuclease YhcR with UshA esterase domain
MKFVRFIFLCLALFPGLVEGESEIPAFDAKQIDDIRAAVGKQIKVRGLIERTGKSKGTGMNFLNFSGGELTVVVFGRSLRNFPKGEPAELFKGKLVEVTGKLEFYKEKPQIVLEHPSEITLLDQQKGEPVKVAEQKSAPALEKTPAESKVEAPGKKKAPRVKVDPRIYFDDP